MNTLLLIFWILLAISLLVVTAMRPPRTRRSRFELERLQDKAALRRERLLGGVLLLLWLKSRLLIVLSASVAIVLWQGWGIVVSAVLLVAVEVLSRIRFVNRQAMRLYDSQENRLLRIVERVKLLRWLGRTQLETYSDQRLESTEQLLHLVESAGHFLSSEQQKLIKKGLRWHGKEVGKVMTPLDEIITVRKNELLGPLVLDDLHKTGHFRFPVVASGLDNVLGQINIADLLEVDSGKKSQTAADIMTPLDVRLHEDTPLPEALRQLMEHPGKLGLVIDDADKTIGLISLSDVLRALLG